MRRADRLFRIVQFLRKRRRAVTARVIGDEFGVCTRTVYRDIQDLIDSGVPILGEAGVGYVMDKAYLLPPIMFDIDELEAIALGITMVKSWTDETFARRAGAALEKIHDVLPAQLLDRIQQLVLFSLPSQAKIPWEVSFSDIRECIRRKQKVQFAYSDERGCSTTRTVRPLAMVFFGPVWLMVAWCEKRRDFRNFRLDRMKDLELSQEFFVDEADKTLQRYVESTVCDVRTGLLK
jgi:predicted DNA-binding transcriptional regulator YafY